MDDILTRYGFRVAVMKADAVPPDRREAWVADKVKRGIDVLICHPRLAQTGLDLIDFPTICWYETDYSVYVMRQASRRSWRIGQTRPVTVVFMSYRNTIQASALKLGAKNLQSSFAVEIEPESVNVNANGSNGKGHAADGIWPSVELVLGNGQGPHPELVMGSNGHASNGDGHHDDAAEKQRSLFSWAEFLTDEPVKRNGRNGKPNPGPTCRFEWVFSLENGGEDGCGPDVPALLRVRVLTLCLDQLAGRS